MCWEYDSLGLRPVCLLKMFTVLMGYSQLNTHGCSSTALLSSHVWSCLLWSWWAFSLSQPPSAICWQSRSQTVLCNGPPPLRPPRSGYSRPLVDLLCVLKLHSLKAVMEIEWGNPQRFLGGISWYFFLCHPLYYFNGAGIMEWKAGKDVHDDIQLRFRIECCDLLTFLNILKVGEILFEMTFICQLFCHQNLE